MNKVFVKRFEITSFKNLKNITFDTNGKSVGITGKNGIGKSNLLNAIYWCLTGYDLNGNSSNDSFIPNYDPNEKVDVTIELNVGTIQRKEFVDLKGSCSQYLVVDGVQTDSLSEGEILIDKMLGILPFTIGSNFLNKEFNLRQFLMNPTYHLTLTPKAIRDVICKRLSHEFKGTIEFNPLFKSLLDKELESQDNDDVDYYSLIENLFVKASASKKKTDDELKLIKSFEDYVADKGIDLSSLNDRKNELLEQKKSDEQLMLIIDAARQELNKALEETSGNKFKLHTITSKGVSKNDYSYTIGGFDIEQRSTSQSVYDSILLIKDYLYGIGCDVELPLFIDRFESCDQTTMKKLFEFQNQLLITKVTKEGETIKLWQI